MKLHDQRQWHECPPFWGCECLQKLDSKFTNVFAEMKPKSCPSTRHTGKVYVTETGRELCIVNEKLAHLRRHGTSHSQWFVLFESTNSFKVLTSPSFYNLPPSVLTLLKRPDPPSAFWFRGRVVHLRWWPQPTQRWKAWGKEMFPATVHPTPTSSVGRKILVPSWQQHLEGLMNVCRALPGLKMKDSLWAQRLIDVCYFECFAKGLFSYKWTLIQELWEGHGTEESQVWSSTRMFFLHQSFQIQQFPIL